MAGMSSFPGRAVFQQLVQDSVQTAGIVIALIVARVYSTGFRLTMKEWPARIAVRRAVDGSVQEVVFQEYVDAALEARHRVAGLEDQIRSALSAWSLRPVAEALISLRGIDVLAAVTVLAELGDLTRFDSPRQLMSFLGLVPSEHSSGSRRRQGAITRTGNSHVRRVLVQAAWNYRFPARKTAHLQRKAASAPGPGAGGRMGGAETAVWPLPASRPCRKAALQGHDRSGPGTGRLHLGHCLRSV